MKESNNPMEKTIILGFLKRAEELGDERARQVFDSYRGVPERNVAREAVSEASYRALKRARLVVLRQLMDSVQALAELDDQLCRVYPRAEASGMEQAVRAAAVRVTRSADWGALFMLMHERGWAISEQELADAVGRWAQGAPQPSRQGIAQAVWDTRRHLYPDWPRGIVSDDKWRRNMAVADAADSFVDNKREPLQ